MNGNYRIDVKCWNCKKVNWNVEIPKGMSIEEFGEQTNVKCETCGCHAIKVKPKKEIKVKTKEEKKSKEEKKDAN